MRFSKSRRGINLKKSVTRGFGWVTTCRMIQAKIRSKTVGPTLKLSRELFLLSRFWTRAQFVRMFVPIRFYGNHLHFYVGSLMVDVSWRWLPIPGCGVPIALHLESLRKRGVGNLFPLSGAYQLEIRLRDESGLRIQLSCLDTSVGKCRVDHRSSLVRGPAATSVRLAWSNAFVAA
jgi:hypothetical protein